MRLPSSFEYVIVPMTLNQAVPFASLEWAMPTRSTSPLEGELVILKTGEPLSPPCTLAVARYWQMNVIPPEPMFAQVLSIVPRVHPVVLPIFSTVTPALGQYRSALILNRGLLASIVTEPRPVVRAMYPRP